MSRLFPGGDDVGQRRFLPEDPDFGVAHLDAGDNRPQVGFAGLRVTLVELAAHQGCEGVDFFGCVVSGVAGLGGEAVERGLGEIAVGLQRANAFLQVVVEIDHALLDGAIKTGEPVQLLGEFALETLPALRDGTVLAIRKTRVSVGRSWLVHVTLKPPSQIPHNMGI